MSKKLNQNQTLYPSKVLIVIDMQKDFVDPTGSLFLGHDTTNLINSMSNYIADFKGRVVYTLDTHDSDSCEFNSFPPHCIIDTDGHKLTDKVSQAIRDREQATLRPIAGLQKKSFTGTNVSEFLSNMYKDAEFHLVGVCTHICVHDIAGGLVNAFKEKHNKIPKITIVKDLIDDFDPEMAEQALVRMQKLYGVEVA